MSDLTFTCPVCGAGVPRKAKACPECGACEKSGWSEDQYLDGLNLPDEDWGARPRPPGLSRFWWVVTVIVLLAFALLALRGMW
jgi:hypothetical protein